MLAADVNVAMITKAISRISQRIALRPPALLDRKQEQVRIR